LKTTETDLKALKDLYTQQSSYYGEPRKEMISFLPDGAKTILDVGCGDGEFGENLKKTRPLEVWGVELNEEAARTAKSRLDKVLPGSIDQHLEALPNHYFDAIFFNDVLEHIPDPYQLLEKMKIKLSLKGAIISSIPNVRYIQNLRNLLFKRDWKYEDSGILDRTHLRFFTEKSIRRMFEDLNFEIVELEGINPTKSLRPCLYNLFTLGRLGMDTKFKQFAVVAQPSQSTHSI
jgi:2-polyprenyl-3-methyl-5-hydroxy-6-metoxy-1,4-benzoquinol methylase